MEVERNKEKENLDPVTNRENDLFQKRPTTQPIVIVGEVTEGTGLEACQQKHKLPEADDFILMKPISRGAFGKVFIGCKKKDPDKIYAIKVLKKSELINKNLIAQVTIERDALAMMHSPFVVEIYYSLQSEHHIYLVMEYLAGGDVKSLLIISGFFKTSQAVMYTAEIALALEHLHRKGIIHRDLKPDNMLIAGNGHIKLTDFGLSKVTLDINSTPVRTSQTPMSRLNQYRTPGQILSLRSSLTFSAPKCQGSAKRPPMQRSRSSKNLKPLLGSPRRICSNSGNALASSVSGDSHQITKVGTSGTAAVKILTKPYSALLSPKRGQSLCMPPHAKSLTPAFKESLGWKRSDSLEDCHMTIPTPGISNASSSSLSNISHIQGHYHHSSVFFCDDILSSTRHNLSTADLTSGDDGGSGGGGEGKGEKEGGALDCLSHDRLATKRDGDQDSTPLLHRTDAAVYNSFSARNLRSFRESSPLDDDSHSHSEEEHNSKFLPPPSVPQHVGASLIKLDSVPEESESLPNSQDGDVTKLRSSTEPGSVAFCRKRSFDAVAELPAGTGLTQEVLIMRLGEVKGESVNGPQPFGKQVSETVDSSNKVQIGLASFMEIDRPLQHQLELAPHKVRITSHDSSSAESDMRSSPPNHLRLLSDDLLNSDPLTPLRSFNLSDMYDPSMPSSPETEKEDHVSDREDRIKPFHIFLPKFGHAQQQPTIVDEVRGGESRLHLTPAANSLEGDARGVPQSAPGTDHFSSSTTPAQTRGTEDSLTGADKLGHKAPKNVDFKGDNSLRQIKCMSVTNIYPKRSDYSEQITPDACVSEPKPIFFQSDLVTPKRRPLSTSQPHKTPREGVRRGPEPGTAEEGRIWGTPDYLAPEILRQEKHGSAVDWWSLGVCLFEFVTGLPPFNDETPELVFSNILNRAISWPTDMTELTAEAIVTINSLLTMDPSHRPGARELKSMALFSDVDWDHLLEKQPEFIPQMEDAMDTSYFDPKNLQHQLTVSAVDIL